MIINNLGDESLNPGSANYCVAQWSNPRTIAYIVTSSDGFKVQGAIPPSNYLSFNPSGKPPYTVGVGFENKSYWTEATGVGATDAVTFIQIWPAGPSGGGPIAIVNKGDTTAPKPVE